MLTIILGAHAQVRTAHELLQLTATLMKPVLEEAMSLSEDLVHVPSAPVDEVKMTAVVLPPSAVASPGVIDINADCRDAMGAAVTGKIMTPANRMGTGLVLSHPDLASATAACLADDYCDGVMHEKSAAGGYTLGGAILAVPLATSNAAYESFLRTRCAETFSTRAAAVAAVPSTPLVASLASPLPAPAATDPAAALPLDCTWEALPGQNIVMPYDFSVRYPTLEEAKADCISHLGCDGVAKDSLGYA